MKRIKVVVLFLVTLLLITGCSSNSLKCTKEENNKTSKITVTFNKNNSIKTLNLIEKITYDKLDAHIDLEYYELKEKYSILDNLNGVTYKIKENKNDITITLNVDYTLLENDNYSLITISKNTDKTTTETNLNSIGYTCK